MKVWSGWLPGEAQSIEYATSSVDSAMMREEGMMQKMKNEENREYH